MLKPKRGSIRSNYYVRGAMACCFPGELWAGSVLDAFRMLFGCFWYRSTASEHHCVDGVARVENTITAKLGKGVATRWVQDDCLYKHHSKTSEQNWTDKFYLLTQNYRYHGDKLCVLGSHLVTPCPVSSSLSLQETYLSGALTQRAAKSKALLKRLFYVRMCMENVEYIYAV